MLGGLVSILQTIKNFVPTFCSRKIDVRNYNPQA